MMGMDKDIEKVKKERKNNIMITPVVKGWENVCSNGDWHSALYITSPLLGGCWVAAWLHADYRKSAAPSGELFTFDFSKINAAHSRLVWSVFLNEAPEALTQADSALLSINNRKHAAERRKKTLTVYQKLICMHGAALPSCQDYFTFEIIWLFLWTGRSFWESFIIPGPSRQDKLGGVRCLTLRASN